MERFGGAVPTVTPALTAPLCRAVHDAIRRDLAASVAPVALGGLGFALAKGAMSGGLGLTADLAAFGPLSPEAALFSETPGRFLVSVAPQNAAAFEALFVGQALTKLGSVRPEPVITLSAAAAPLAQLDLAGLVDSYKKPLNW